METPTPIASFCKAYLEKLETDKNNETRRVCDPIFFWITKIIVSEPPYGHRSETLLRLDDEDIEYLYNKYSKLLEAEMKDNIDKITKKYNEIKNHEEIK